MPWRALHAATQTAVGRAHGTRHPAAPAPPRRCLIPTMQNRSPAEPEKPAPPAAPRPAHPSRRRPSCYPTPKLTAPAVQHGRFPSRPTVMRLTETLPPPDNRLSFRWPARYTPRVGWVSDPTHVCPICGWGPARRGKVYGGQAKILISFVTRTRAAGHDRVSVTGVERCAATTHGKEAP